MKEIVLASGRFARVRPMKWIDFAISFDPAYQMWVLRMAARIVTLDEQPMTLALIEDMDLTDAAPLITMISQDLSIAIGQKAVS